MSTSIVIVTYQTGPALWLAVESSLAQPECGELIVIDNGNPPDVLSRLLNMAAGEPRLMLIYGHGNVGFARACNMGMRAASEDYILLLNPDCILPPGALAQVREARESQGAMLAGCFLMNPDGSEQRGGRRELLTPKTAWQDVFGSTMALPEGEGGEVPAISGAFIFMAKETCLALHGMDEGYFLHMEDMDFCMRARKAGGKIIWVPQVKVLHLRSTSHVFAVKLEWHKVRGFMRYFRKYFGGPLLPVWCAGILGRFVVKAAQALWNDFNNQQQRQKIENNRLIWLLRAVKPKPVKNELAEKIVLVTGASSQVGICTIAELLNAGAQVVALTHKTIVPFAHERLRWMREDLTIESWILKDLKPDIIVHAAGLWLLPPVLSEMLAAGAKRVIAFSSMSAVTKQESTSPHEREVAQKLMSAEKSIAEICDKKNIPFTLLRPTMIYGLGLDKNVTRLAAALRKFCYFPLYKSAGGIRQPVHAQDLAVAVLQCIPNPQTYGKTYELGGATRLTYRHLVEQVGQVFGLTPRFFVIPRLPSILTAIGFAYQIRDIHGEMALRMNRDMVCDVTAAQQDFSFFPRPFSLNSSML